MKTLGSIKRRNICPDRHLTNTWTHIVEVSLSCHGLTLPSIDLPYSLAGTMDPVSRSRPNASHTRHSIRRGISHHGSIAVTPIPARQLPLGEDGSTGPIGNKLQRDRWLRAKHRGRGCDTVRGRRSTEGSSREHSVCTEMFRPPLISGSVPTDDYLCWHNKNDFDQVGFPLTFVGRVS